MLSFIVPSSRGMLLMVFSLEMGSLYAVKEHDWRRSPH